jgi:hypothetical protein
MVYDIIKMSDTLDETSANDKPTIETVTSDEPTTSNDKSANDTPTIETIENDKSANDTLKPANKFRELLRPHISDYDYRCRVSDAAITLAESRAKDLATRRLPDIDASWGFHPQGAPHCEQSSQCCGDDNEELTRMYSVLIPGYKNEKSVEIVGMAAMLRDISIPNTKLLEILDQLNFFDVDNAVFIAHYSKNNDEDAGVYHEACRVVCDVWTTASCR